MPSLWTLYRGKASQKEQILHLPKFQDPKLCVFTVLQHYLDRTAALRRDNADQLFIISRKPYTAAAQDTISGWIRQCMSAAGIDTSVYKTHSTRKASTSTASESFVPIGTIMRAAGWSNSVTFAQFYKLPVVDHASFANSVLSRTVPLSHHNQHTDR